MKVDYNLLAQEYARHRQVHPAVLKDLIQIGNLNSASQYRILHHTIFGLILAFKGFLNSALCTFYFYLVFANAFNLPTVSQQVFFHSEVIAWLGVFFCLVGLLLLLWGLISFGQSFRVGIDTEKPDKMCLHASSVLRAIV